MKRGYLDKREVVEASSIPSLRQKVQTRKKEGRSNAEGNAEGNAEVKRWEFDLMQ